jgi:hypothetical protein
MAYSPPDSLRKRLEDCAWADGTLLVCSLLVGNAEVCTGNVPWVLDDGGAACCGEAVGNAVVHGNPAVAEEFPKGFDAGDAD